ELLFIVTHQAYELWFRLILWELEGTIAALGSDDPRGATHRLRRGGGGGRGPRSPNPALETMKPAPLPGVPDPPAAAGRVPPGRWEGVGGGGVRGGGVRLGDEGPARAGGVRGGPGRPRPPPAPFRRAGAPGGVPGAAPAPRVPPARGARPRGRGRPGRDAGPA